MIVKRSTGHGGEQIFENGMFMGLQVPNHFPNFNLVLLSISKVGTCGIKVSTSIIFPAQVVIVIQYSIACETQSSKQASRSFGQISSNKRTILFHALRQTSCLSFKFLLFLIKLTLEETIACKSKRRSIVTLVVIVITYQSDQAHIVDRYILLLVKKLEKLTYERVPENSIVLFGNRNLPQNQNQRCGTQNHTQVDDGKSSFPPCPLVDRYLCNYSQKNNTNCSTGGDRNKMVQNSVVHAGNSKRSRACSRVSLLVDATIERCAA